MNAQSLIMLAEIRHQELLADAARERLAMQAAIRHRNRDPRGSDLRAAVKALGACINTMRSRGELTKPIELTPAAPETM